MIKEAWDSFKENVKDRITNPFLGTFLVVWVAHHWKVIYAFFNFDKDWNLEKKIRYFNDYWNDKNFVWNLIVIALITIGILIITYFFLALARYLANLFENIIIPNIQKISKGKIVTAETYQNALEEITSLKVKIETERKAKNEAVLERDELEKRVYQTSETKGTSENREDDSRSFDPLIRALNVNYGESEIDKTFVDISKNNSIPNSNGVADFLLKSGFIKYKSRNANNGNIYYDFTNDGDVFRKTYYRETAK